MERKNVYSIMVDPQNPKALAIIELNSCEIVERGILPADGITAWGVAKVILDKMNADAEKQL